jgi:uncharacterized damage-inducible protein DinB
MNLQTELIAEYDREIATTRKILQAIPDDADFSWKASPKNMTLGRLAAHTAETAGEWARDTLSKPGLVFDMATYVPWRPTTKAEVLEVFERDTAESRALLASLDPAKWEDRWTMTAQTTDGVQTWIDNTRYRVYRSWVINHLIHHRAQLGRDLRVLGASIPGSYGPSADES